MAKDETEGHRALTLRRVYKYPLRIDDETEVMMPMGAQVLAVQEQQGCPCIWALVDPNAISTRRRFRIAGTGHDIQWRDGHMIHRGTFQLRAGALVFHLFEYV